MKIAHFIATNFVGGPEKQILRHIMSLNSQNIESCLISFTEDGGQDLANRAKTRVIDTLLLSPSIGSIVTNIRQIRKFHARHRFDVLVTHGYKANILSQLVKLSGGPPIAAFSRGWTGENWRVKCYEMLDLLVIRFADRIVAVSQSQKNKLLGGHVPNTRIDVVYNAYDTSTMESIARTLPPKNGPLSLLTAGRLSPEKGHRYLLNAAAQLNKRGVDFTLKIAGDGPLRESLETLTCELALEKQVEFLGFVDPMEKLYQDADLFILPSLSEGLPNVILEAFYWRVPVVATKAGGIPEIIEHGHNGILCDVGDADGLADAIIHTAEDAHLTRGLVGNAQQTLEETFDLERQTQQLMRIYESIVH